jgi:hypothetical protein
MRLLQLAEVQKSTRDRVFRYSSERTLLLALVAVCASTALFLTVWREVSVLAYYIAGVLLFSTVLMRRLILARFRSSNWLVRMSDDGVLIKFRSYLNYHLPAEDRTVAFIPYQEIRSARLVRERAKVASYSRKVSTQTRRLVEFELAGDTAPLTKALAREFARRAPHEKHWYGSTSTLYNHYPVHMVSPSFLQVEWGVVPGAQIFLDGLREFTTAAAPIELSQDFTHLDGMSQNEQEKHLRELAKRGQTISAIYIARRLYSYNLNQARTFVEGLHNGNEMP